MKLRKSEFPQMLTDQCIHFGDVGYLVGVYPTDGDNFYVFQSNPPEDENGDTIYQGECPMDADGLKYHCFGRQIINAASGNPTVHSRDGHWWFSPLPFTFALKDQDFQTALEVFRDYFKLVAKLDCTPDVKVVGLQYRLECEMAEQKNRGSQTRP